MSEAKIGAVERGIKTGNRVKIRSGEVNGVDLTGLEAVAIRDEEFRGNGASSRSEEMVMVEVPLPSGGMSYPIDMPRRRLKGPKDGGFRGFMRVTGKLFGIIKDGKYVRVAQ